MAGKNPKTFLENLIKFPLNKLGYDIVRFRSENFDPIKRQNTDGFSKVFGIGFNKTATTTLGLIFKMYGLNVPDQAEQEGLLTQNVLNGEYKDLEGFVEKYDAFQDLPFSQGYAFIACDVLFPGSKFILTIRDEEAWFNSLYNFHKKSYGFADRSEIDAEFFRHKNFYLSKNYVFENKKRFITTVIDQECVEDWGLIYDKQHYQEMYRRRNEEIITYFKNRPDDLLVIDLTKESTTEKVVEFLGLGAETIMDMPHENKT
ncbi:MAG: hypothetical protein HKN18_14700 [Silicimonas sp.]|nr:hypothetical protein [Silicimonas sp.]